MITPSTERMMSALLTCLVFSSALFASLDCSDAGRKEGPRATHDGGSLLTSLNRSARLPPVYVGPQAGLKEADRIAALPGQPEGVNLSQYAGYVTVDPKNGRALFYYFVESPTDSTTKPLVLWLNGGPGGSSLGYGALQEIGPFRVNSDGRTLHENVYAWTKVANIIFLESPAGVGFSYSNTSSDYRANGDRRTADDSLTFLVNWLERYSEYANRDFYITGESYAGHYVPQLAKLILQQNHNNTHKPINLQGIAIGNADLDDNLYVRERYEFLWSHAMYSDETHASILKSCNTSVTSADCMRARFQADEETGRINLYNIYAPPCNGNSSAGSNVEYDPCAGGYVFNYMNNPSVQNALHAVPRNWSAYSMLDWSDREPTMLYIMKQLITSGVRVLLYSGDMDAVVPVTFTKSFIKLLGLPVESPWRPWYNIAEVGGYVVGYKKGLSFVTVRGAGHEVPSYQGQRALHMISSFFQGKLP